MYLKDTPFEIWLKNGPFGTSPGEKYAHLQDPETACQRLLGLLLRFDVKMYELNKQTRMNPQTLAEWQAAGVTHLLWVKSNLSQLINQNKEKSRLFVRQALMEHKSRLVNTASRTEFVRTQTLTDLEKFNDTPVKKSKLPTGIYMVTNLGKRCPQTEQRPAGCIQNGSCIIMSRAFLPGRSL
ncbi:hypothetical protein P4S72_06715 [Vibrio sp. PP-XX7]